MEDLIHSFFNRSQYETLTEDTLSTIADEDLEQAVVDNIQAKLKADFSNEYEVLTQLSKGRQAIYSTYYLEAEVDNGGFNQFFYNSTGRFAQEAYEGLLQIGAVKLAELMSQAISIYTENQHQITTQQDGTLEGFSHSYQDNPLNELDNHFYELMEEEDLLALRINYIRANPKEFVD